MTYETALRPAGAADLPAIFRAERHYMRTIEPAELGSWTEAIDRNLELWVDNLARTTMLVADGQTAGYVMWSRRPAAAALLTTVQVLPACRRRGYGLRLLEVFAEQARGDGAKVLRLGVHEDNPARPIYDVAGYHVTGRDQAYVLYEQEVR